MPKYKVYGILELEYTVEVEADDRGQAFDKADELSTIDWTQTETDNVINIYDLEEIDG